MKYSSIDEDNIKLVVNSFYSKVRGSEKLSPIFNEHIGTTDELWGSHIDKIALFWNMVILGKEGYKGFPLREHMKLMPMDLNLFDDWLALFKETLSEIYDEEATIKFYSYAEKIGSNFKLGLSNFAKFH